MTTQNTLLTFEKAPWSPEVISVLTKPVGFQTTEIKSAETDLKLRYLRNCCSLAFCLFSPHRLAAIKAQHSVLMKETASAVKLARNSTTKQKVVVSAAFSDKFEEDSQILQKYVTCIANQLTGSLIENIQNKEKWSPPSTSLPALLHSSSLGVILKKKLHK
jgi:hypothetical protein